MARGDIRSDWYVALGTSNLDIQPADGDEYLITGWASESNGPLIHGRAGSDHTGPFQLGDFGAMTGNASIIDTSGKNFSLFYYIRIVRNLINEHVKILHTYFIAPNEYI